MNPFLLIEKLVTDNLVWTVSCQYRTIVRDEGIATRLWVVLLNDNHARTGQGKGKTIEEAAVEALNDLNNNCGGQIQNYIELLKVEPN